MSNAEGEKSVKNGLFIHLYKCLILSDHVFRLLVWNFNHYKIV